LEAILGNSLATFLLLTFVVFGWTAFATGNGVAVRWQSARRVVAYCCLLAAAERFIDHALADGELLSIGGFLLSAVALSLIGLFAWRVTHARMMVTQYPWLYEPAGLFGWRQKAHL
jgi:branched-chain amino acid transport system ATP-binding protein